MCFVMCNGEFYSTTRITRGHLWPLEFSTACIAVRWSRDDLTVLPQLSLDVSHTHRQGQECKTTRSNNIVTKIQVFWMWQCFIVPVVSEIFRNLVCSSSEVRQAFLLDCLTLDNESTAVLQNCRNHWPTVSHPRQLNIRCQESVMSVQVIIKWQR